MDWNAPHIGFVIASYLISFIALMAVVISSVRLSRRRNIELKRLEDELRKRNSGS